MAGAGMQMHFYVDGDEAAERCKTSFRTRTPIAIGGTDAMTGRIRSYSGVVLSVEPTAVDVAAERWRITMDAT